MQMQIVLIIMQFFIAFALFNVWVLRYQTMAADFRQFGLPVWLRNIVGVIKMILSAMLIAGIWNHQYAVIGSVGIAIMMIGAVAVHIKERDPLPKLLPAIGLAILSIIVAVLANHYKFVG